MDVDTEGVDWLSWLARETVTANLKVNSSSLLLIVFFACADSELLY